MKHLKYSKVGILLFTILFMSLATFAQNRKIEKVQALKVAFITEKVHLSSSQAERFWPVYNRYENDVRRTRQQFWKSSDQNKSNVSREEARKLIENNLDYQEAVIDLKRKYNDQFLKIISAQQLANLYSAEREFKQMLIQKLRERRGRKN